MHQVFRMFNMCYSRPFKLRVRSTQHVKYTCQISLLLTVLHAEPVYFLS